MSAFHSSVNYVAQAQAVAALPPQPEEVLVDTRAAFQDPAAMVKFVTAGNATLTVVGRKDRYTFKVTRAKRRQGQGEEHAPWYVSGLCGPDNELDYQHLGVLFPGELGGVAYVHSKRSPLAPDAPIAIAATWFFARLKDPTILTKVQVYHEGRCGRCGRKLTVPESIVTGFGPACGGL
jgi:hypothetical protein